MTTGPLDRIAGQLADRYRIERELGAGGMATVYLAQDLRHDRRVAIKVLKPELAAVIGGVRFLAEIKTTANLHHPHILPLHDSGEVDGTVFYVMPFVDGESLRDRLAREKQLPIPDALRIATEVAGALQYAHEHGVIHRDIKPENILLHGGHALVADFGIALAAGSTAGGRMTETGMSLGTPTYMSPEQAMGERTLDARTDVYALGCVLYEMLAGEPPFTGPTAQSIVAKVMTERPASLTARRDRVPAPVEAAVLTALEKLPADRFDSARSFMTAFGDPAFATGYHPSPGRGTARPGVSAGTFRATAAVAVVAVIAATLGWLRRPPPAEVNRLAIALPDSQSIGSRSSNNLRLAISPDGRTIAYVGGPVGGAQRIWLRRLDALTAIPLEGTENGFNPAFSPDGTRLAFVSGSPRAIKTVALTGGPPITLTDSLVDQGGVSWASDGYIYYDGHLASDGLARIPETGGRPESVSTPDSAGGESWHSSPSALPDGKGVLIAIARLRGAGGVDVGVVDPKTGSHKVLAHGVGAAYAAPGYLLYVTAEGNLMAAPFDLDKREMTGVAVPVAQGIAIRALGRVDFAVSRAGTLVYLAGDGRDRIRELAWVDRNGETVAVDSLWSAPLANRPALSPDGRAVGVMVQTSGAPQVWVKQLDRGPATKLADEGGTPSWSPDGRDVVYSARGGWARGPADGSTLARIVPTRSSVLGPQLSPDGKWILYSTGSDILIQAAEGDTGARLLVGGPGSQRGATVSPDGRWLAYMSDESGRFEVYVRPFPNAQVAKHQVSANGAWNPRWSRDGRELFFSDEPRDLISVPVTLVPTFSAGTPMRLFAAADFGMPTWGFDVSLDGKRFLMTRPTGGGKGRPDALVLVQNFGTQLTASPKR